MELRVLRRNVLRPIVLRLRILRFGHRRVGPLRHVVIGCRVDRIAVGRGVQFHDVCDVRGLRDNRLVGRITQVGGGYLGVGLGFFVRVYVVAVAVLRVHRGGFHGLGLCFGLGLGLRFGLDRGGDHDLRLDHNLGRALRRFLFRDRIRRR